MHIYCSGSHQCKKTGENWELTIHPGKERFNTHGLAYITEERIGGLKHGTKSVGGGKNYHPQEERWIRQLGGEKFSQHKGKRKMS